MKRKKQAKTELSVETWAKLRRLIEAGKIENITTGIAQAVEEFVEKFERGLKKGVDHENGKRESQA